MRLHWKESRGDAEKLRALAQRIHEQVEAGAGQVPAGLAGELKEVQKLSKRLKEELLL